ncbi:Uncharacterised protein [Bordetella pertussis]|nr:Uncharacterised protein [Bordetella pertussis]
MVSILTVPPNPPLPSTRLCGPLSTSMRRISSGSMKTEPWRYFSKPLGAPSRTIFTSSVSPMPQMFRLCPPGRGEPAIEMPGS